MNSGSVAVRAAVCGAVLGILALACGARAASATVRFGAEGAVQWTSFARGGTALVPEILPGGRVTSWTGEGGLTAELPLRGRWTLAGALAWSPIGDREKFALLGLGGGTFYTSLRMVALPVRLEWRRAGWRLGAGPEARYLVSAHGKLEDATVSFGGIPGPARARPARGTAAPTAQIFENVGSLDGVDITDAFERWTVAASGLVGRDFPAGRHVLRTELRWSEGLMNASKLSNPTRRTRAAQLGLGLLW
jgi:hypothetical protein